ncbi:MAG: hypothetical protein O3B01_18980 [Planctomycetota bacterium]|nr:hypothetical protein [Planctomycetota bacterium]
MRIPPILVALLAFLQSLQADFIPAFKSDALDLEHCIAWQEDIPLKANERTLRSILGLGNENEREFQRWVGPVDVSGDTRGSVEGNDHRTFYFQLSFNQPVEIGSALSEAAGLLYLKSDAAYPAKPGETNKWEEAPAWPNQSGLFASVFPAGVKTRSVCLPMTMYWHRHPRSLETWLFFKERLLNLSPAGHANASEEYVPPPPHLGPRQPRNAARVLATGRGPAWQNTGKDREGMIRRPAIDKTSPVWVMLSWRTPQSISALLPIGEIGSFDLSYYDGPPAIPPKVGTRREWRSLNFERTYGGLLKFSKTVLTRGLRLNITTGSGREPAIARLIGLHAYSELGISALPEFVKQEKQTSPLQIDYELPHAALATMVVDNPEGRRVSNLFSVNEKAQGKQQVEWNGKDLDGRYVLPGKYKWKAIYHKPLELQYQFTAYPNITENTPWQIGHHGPGGWMADHTPPMACTTFGDRIWFGSPVAESGVSFIECDLDGKKITGWHSFEAWTGPKLLATDGKTVFICHPKENEDPIWGYDIKEHQVSTVLRQPSTETRRTGVRGMAAADGQLYLSIRATHSWVVMPFGAPSVDGDNCLPRYRPARKPRKPHEVVPDPGLDTLRLFRLAGTPPGQGSVGLTYLETEDEAGRRHHIVLALKKSQAIGSAVFPFPELKEDTRFYISVLKPDGKYPPDPNDKSQWIRVNESGKRGWEVAAFPPNTVTRAVRLTWELAGDDPLADLEEDFNAKGKSDLGLDALGVDGGKKSGPKWQGRLEGMTFLRRRYENLLSSATVRVSSGEVRDNGEWWGAPKTPISSEYPGIYLMEWQKPAKVRGLAIKEIDGQTTEIDVFTGPPGAKVDLAGEQHWTQVGTYKQKRRNFYQPDDTHNSRARYLDGSVDFGDIYETRAVRLRVIENFQPVEGRPWGVREDRGGTEIDPMRVRVYGVAPLGYIGGEAPVDARQTERIVVYDLAAKKYTRELNVEKPGQIALGKTGDSPDDNLFALSDNNVIRVDLKNEAPEHEVILRDLEAPGALAVGPDGRFYVSNSTQQVVHVFNADGTPLRTIGTPGGREAGPWDIHRFQNISSLTVDKDNNFWVVEHSYRPKRITKWTADGEFIREHLGPTQYGGGGVLDPYDKNKLYYQGMEFELDWEKRTSRLSKLLWTGPSEPGEVPIMIGDRKYMVTRDCFGGQEAAIVYTYEKDRLKLIGAVGRASGFKELRDPRVLSELGAISLPEYRFTWSDRNGDGKVQASEVWLKQLKRYDRGGIERFNVGNFNRDLSINGGTFHYRVTEILPNGAPVWQEVAYPQVGKLDAFGSQYSKLPEGDFFHFGQSHARITPEGDVRWQVGIAGVGVQALTSAPPFYPGQACAEFTDITHPCFNDAPDAGELGGFRVHHSNPGAWNIWTRDGLFAGYLFRDQRHANTPMWTMPEHHQGLRLDGHHPGQEHFQGYFTRANDGNYYMVAGHNHASIIKVKGIETFKRLSGELEVTADMLQRLKDFEIGQESEEVYSRARVYDLYRMKIAPKIDGQTKDWDATPNAEISNEDPDAEPPASFKMGYDADNLYLLYDVRLGPLKNSGRDWRALFKTGASVDLQWSVKPGADDTRQAPVEGDQRLLITYINGNEPAAVLYRPVAPDAPEGSEYEVVSPVFKISFDEVRRIHNFQIARGADRGYVLEIAIPLTEIGFNPKLGERYRFDWGVLTTDNSGNSCTSRLYWSNKATGILADAPSEAIMMPHLWGHMRVNELRKGGPADLDSLSSFGEKEAGTDDIDIEKEFED